MILQLTIDRFEQDKAVLKAADGTTTIWPKDKLPADSREGQVLNFDISDNQSAGQNHKKLAKDILNEILNVES